MQNQTDFSNFTEYKTDVVVKDGLLTVPDCCGWCSSHSSCHCSLLSESRNVAEKLPSSPVLQRPMDITPVTIVHRTSNRHPLSIVGYYDNLDVNTDIFVSDLYSLSSRYQLKFDDDFIYDKAVRPKERHRNKRTFKIYGKPIANKLNPPM